ncbi:alpha/beta hydrolase fold [Gloeomargarita lithophora Alchichica-D10]|uniref:Alpha/beta hydrolase fold n=1 Tax=Gloeomargarita lithophora Alchichica-D10 TaxID=1188229 RepID=A0A1J0ACE8_9CYAN|nr:alpha/beta hydrolase [Gloeomargarita lithophora]APB33602.1 alpha/beta hydrolase fold [Gloeomargarita lithophora Alchichica-D10]
MPPILVIHISDLTAQGVNYHQGSHFVFENHQLRKGQSFSATMRSQALSLAEQYQTTGSFCLLVEQDGMLTLCREEPPTLIHPAPTLVVTPAEPTPEIQTPVAKPQSSARLNFLFAPKPSPAPLPEPYRHLPTEAQALAQLLIQVRQDFTKQKVRAGGLTWEYWVGGAGQTGVLFLPGTVHLGDMWFPYLHHWQGDFRLLAPTYPPASSIEQLVEGVRQILKQEQLHRVHLVGQSLGGMVVLALLRKYPVLVDKVILSHTGVGVPAKERVAKARQTERQLQAMPQSQITTLAYQSIVNKHLVNVPDQEFWRAYFQEALTQRTSKIEFISLNCRVVADFFQHYRFESHSLNAPPHPVLIVNTDNDFTFDPSEQMALNALFPEAQTLTCTGTGHYSMLVDSQTVMPRLAEFLQ